jgi:hypothetical protein
MRNKAIYLSICVSLTTVAGWGQQSDQVNVGSSKFQTRVDLHREIKLDNTSESEDIILNIDVGVDRLEVIISSIITSGNLKIELFDPKGASQGTFSVGTQLAKKIERVKGNINKSLNDPQAGVWKVTVVPKYATGNLVIQTAEHSDGQGGGQ